MGRPKKYVQVIASIKAAVAAGRFNEGDLLPSYELLGSEHETSISTISLACKILRTQGVITSRPGYGIYVAKGAKAKCLSSSR